jgi:hypothetical protein
MVEEVKHLHNEVVIHGFRFNSHMSVVNLHPEVRRIAARLYEDGHYHEAISAATKALEVAVRKRSNLPAGGNLMGRAFADDGFRFLFIGTSTALSCDASTVQGG